MNKKNKILLLVVFILCLFIYVYYGLYQSTNIPNIYVHVSVSTTTSSPLPTPSQCNATSQTEMLFRQFLETKSLPPRTSFENSLNDTKEIKKFKKNSKQFMFRGRKYLLEKKFGDADGLNSGVFLYVNSDSGHSLVVKTGMKKNEIFNAKMVHENNFGFEILFLGRNFMITENHGIPLTQCSITKSEETCIYFLLQRIMDIFHKEQHIYHCDLHFKQILMNADFTLTVVDWGRSEFVPDAPLNKTYVCKENWLSQLEVELQNESF